MTSCPTTRPGPFRCPTLIESILATVALLPRGRAWPANMGGMVDRFLSWLAAQAGVRPAKWPVGYVQAGFFAALGDVRNFIETRLCDLRLEFWCATHKETHAEWMREYGLPDACDPFPDLCTKVAALGGARCEYFNLIIARLGWRAECYEKSAHCGMRAGCDRAGGRYARAGGETYLGLIIKVHTGEPIVVPNSSTFQRRPRAGIFRAGEHAACDTVEHPSVTPVRCLMERIKPAHVEIQYLT